MTEVATLEGLRVPRREAMGVTVTAPTRAVDGVVEFHPVEECSMQESSAAVHFTRATVQRPLEQGEDEFVHVGLDFELELGDPAVVLGAPGEEGKVTDPFDGGAPGVEAGEACGGVAGESTRHTLGKAHGDGRRGGSIVDEDDFMAVCLGVALVERSDEITHVVGDVEAVERRKVALERPERRHEVPPSFNGKTPRRASSSAARSLPACFQRS